MYGPTQGKAGSFGTAGKNAMAREMQKERKKGKSKYDPWQKFGPTNRERKRGFFKDKNYEIKRRQTREANMGEWMTDIKAQYGQDAQIIRQGSNVNVKTGFQNFSYLDDPMGFGDIQLKDVESFVPEGFTKVKQKDVTFKIVAQAKKYTSKYKRKKGKSSKRSYSTYVPVEAFLDAEGNLTRVVKRDDYRTKSISTDTKREKRYGVMITEDTSFVDNRKVKSQFFDDYRKEARDYSSGDDKDYYSTYLKKVVDYKGGTETAYSRPDTIRDYRDDSPKMETKTYTQTVQLGPTLKPGAELLNKPSPRPGPRPPQVVLEPTMTPIVKPEPKVITATVERKKLFGLF